MVILRPYMDTKVNIRIFELGSSASGTIVILAGIAGLVTIFF